jgi:hypothetical protein
MFIGEKCPEASLEAFRLAIAELKKTTNTSLFADCVSIARVSFLVFWWLPLSTVLFSIQQIHSDKLGDDYGLDAKWVSNTNRAFTEKNTNLEVELNNAKKDGDRDPYRVSTCLFSSSFLSNYLMHLFVISRMLSTRLPIILWVVVKLTMQFPNIWIARFARSFSGNAPLLLSLFLSRMPLSMI